MLKTYICVACEKVLITKQETASLISLFSRIVLQVGKGTQIARDAVLPREWFVFGVWDTEPEDADQEFDCFFQMLYPDGTQFSEVVKVSFKPVAPIRRSQVYFQMPGFPISQKGFYTIKVWIEQAGKQVIAPIEFKLELEIIEVDKQVKNEAIQNATG